MRFTRKGGAAREGLSKSLKKRNTKRKLLTVRRARNRAREQREVMEQIAYLEAQADEMRKQALLLEERAYMIRRAQRHAEGDYSNSSSENNTTPRANAVNDLDAMFGTMGVRR